MSNPAKKIVLKFNFTEVTYTSSRYFKEVKFHDIVLDEKINWYAQLEIIDRVTIFLCSSKNTIGKT